MRKRRLPVAVGDSATPVRRPWRRRLALCVAAGCVLVGIAVAWLASRGSGEHAAKTAVVPTGAAAGFNVLLVTLDTVRADRLGCYGYRLAETPTCDALAAEGVLYADAVTSVPLTLPSHASLLTGLYPPQHGVRDNGAYRLADKHTTLARALKAHGYDTAAFVGCFVLDARFGLDQGFDVYDFAVTADGYRPKQPDFNERPADAVTDAAVGWLRQRKAANVSTPFFMWVHYFDAHLPYTSPLGKEARFAGRGYDAEIAFVDQNLGRLRQDLESLGLWRRTLVIVTADHGEGLGEHQEPTHGMLLYEATVRVPLIMSCAALVSGPVRIDDRLAALVDVRPTIEELLGIPRTEPCDGVRLLGERVVATRAIYLETLNPLHLAGWSPLYALRTHGGKYILAPEPEYYDLPRDPGELQNLWATNPPGLADLVDELARRVPAEGAGTQPARSVSEEEITRLGSLGYVQGAAPATSGSRPDPKTMMDVYLDALRAEELYARGEFATAAELAQAVLADCPQCIQAQRVLAFSYLKLGKPDDAVALLRTAVESRRDVFLVRSLAQVLILTGEYAAASETLDLYESSDPTDGQVPLLRGDILAQQQRVPEALASYEEAVRRDENRVGITARERMRRLQEH